MLATLRIPALLLGVGAGALAATIVALLIEVVVQLVANVSEAGAGLVPGVVVGFVVGGYVAGRMAMLAHRFHGAVTGLGLTALVVFIARLGGSPAGVIPILLLAIVGIIVAGTAGTLAGRRTRSRSSTSHSG